MTLEDPDLDRLYEMGWRAPERFSVKAADGVTDLYGVMWKPADFDSTKLYPIISCVYPGPFFEYVPTRFTINDELNTRLAQIVAAYLADGGRAFTVEPHLFGFGGLAALERAGEHSRIAPRWADANAAFDAACGALDRILREEQT